MTRERENINGTQYHPTSHYDQLTPELQEVYQNFEFCDIHNDFKDKSKTCFRLPRYMPKVVRSSTEDRHRVQGSYLSSTHRQR
eukprot:4694134-Amphidinium_carterae.1